jgi:hypothetical protein
MKLIFFFCLIFLVSCTASNVSDLDNESYSDGGLVIEYVEPNISNISFEISSWSQDVGEITCYNNFKSWVTNIQSFVNSRDINFDNFTFTRMKCDAPDPYLYQQEAEGVVKNTNKTVYIHGYSAYGPYGGFYGKKSACLLIDNKRIYSKATEQSGPDDPIAINEVEASCEWIES